MSGAEFFNAIGGWTVVVEIIGCTALFVPLVALGVCALADLMFPTKKK